MPRAALGLLVGHNGQGEICIVQKITCRPACRFQAVLQTRDGSVIFKVVETNDFNQLPHITLRFRPGSSHDIQHFLAYRLSEAIRHCQRIQQQLTASQVCCVCGSLCIRLPA